MARTDITIDASPQAVWAALADPLTFEYWVVGCQAIRDVEGDWPAVGSVIHHRVGAGAATIEDTTSVVESVPECSLVLRARLRPAGIARVAVTLEPSGEHNTVVIIEEDVVEGPASHLPDVVVDAALHPRNVVSLRRLKQLAEEGEGVPCPS